MQNMFRRLFLYIFVPLFALIYIFILTGRHNIVLLSILAASPILVVLAAMLFFHIGAQVAGPIGFITGLTVAILSFGLTVDVFWVSQLKGLLLSLFVIAIFFPALLLYNTINQAGGIQSIVHALECLITDRPVLLITTAWAFSGLMEGVAGFGLPVAIISPMLVEMGVTPILAVAAVAVGHAWSVTFGDMGVVFQTLTSVVKVNHYELGMNSVFLLGIACLFCGLATAHLLKGFNRWPILVVLSTVMAFTQYIMVVVQIPALASMFAGASGVIGAILFDKYWLHGTKRSDSVLTVNDSLRSALLGYGSLAGIMILITLVVPIKQALSSLVWTISFPEVKTLEGFVTAAVPSQTYRPLIHPGTSILLVTIFCFFYNRRKKLYGKCSAPSIVATTWNISWRAMVGIFSMVGLSALMDHSGMTVELARVLSSLFQTLFPLISPIIGMVGAFATGSNNNSNVLFGPLQERVALILHVVPALIVAAQTTGGSLGSMIAPAKLIVGCTTVNLQGHDGDVLRKTLPYGISIGLLMGVVTLVFAK